MGILNKIANADRVSKSLGIDRLEEAAWQKLGYSVWIPDLIGRNSEYYIYRGSRHIPKEEWQDRWQKAKQSERLVKVRYLPGNSERKSGEVLNEILSLMKKDAIFAASTIDEFISCNAYDRLIEEGIVFDEEILAKVRKYRSSTI